jgi:DNA-directed RNA polymerase specialized sigma24 family protein
MEDQSDDLIPTRATLLGRLKNSKDQTSWQEFFDTYSRLIYGVARKAGLSDEESQEVLQATMDLVAEQMPAFRYDPRIGSFKGWLLNLTRLQIVSRSLKRRPASGRKNDKTAAEADPSARSVEGIWETAWQKNLTEAAISHVKRRLDPKKYQIYDFCVNKQGSLEKAATSFNVTVDEARKAVESIQEMIAAEAKRLEREML